MSPGENIELKRRLLKYSKLIPKCALEASTYAKCVVNKGDNLKKDNCLKEFNQFKNCIKNASSKI